MMVVAGLAVSGHAQKPAADAEATVAIANGQAGFTNPISPFNVNQAHPNQMTISSDTVFDAVTGAVVGAGSGQSSVNTAAGRGQEADGGSALSTGRSETYTIRIGSAGHENHSHKAFPACRNFQRSESCRSSSRET